MPIPRPALAVAGTAFLALTLLGCTLPSLEPVAADPRLADPPLSAPGQWFDSQRAIGADADPRAYAAALDAAADARARTAAAAPEVAGLAWELLGPTNIGGRVVDLATDPSDPAVLHVATASGGVWRSDDLGTTFAPSWPVDLTQAIGAMAAGSDGVLYVGTGEANPGGGSIVYGGTGLYRSRDGAATWEHVGLPTSGAFGRIAVDPGDPQRVFAAAAGNLFVPGGDRGLYRSLDGGDTWERVLEGPNDTTGAIDVAIDPADPDHLLAALWDHYRDPERRVYGGPGSGVYESSDGGDTWRRVPEITLPDPGETGRIGVSFAPSDESRAYAIIANKLDGRHGAFFGSADGGATWTQLPDHATLVASNSSYGWWFARIWVDPDDADRLFVAGLELIESTDGGSTFTAHSVGTVGVLTGAHQVSIHSDQHAMIWHPDVPGLVYLGNDGGVYRSAADGTIGTWVAAELQGWTQHYSVDVSEQLPDYVVSGLQDNLCQRTLADPVTSGALDWTKYGLCGDGLQTVVDPADPTIAYACSQYGNCGRTLAGAPDLRFSMPDARYGWFADIALDPTNPAIIYTAGERVFRSTNRGQGWQPISEDLSSDPEQTDPNPGYQLRGVVTTIAPAQDGQTVWAGTDEGFVWVTRDLGVDGWTRLESPVFPDAWVTRVTVDPRDVDTVYVSFSGFRGGEDGAHVVRSTDGGETWTDLSLDLPDAPVNEVVVAGEDVLVGSDVGVYLLDEPGGAWLRVGDLPSVPVLDLRWHAGTGSLYAATFGHGIQRVALADAAAPLLPF